MKCNQQHILVVDDDQDTADSMARLLCLWGYESEAWYDGATALRSAALHRPAAVLLDLDMPGMNGYEFARRIRELRKCKQVPILAITGITSKASQDRARCCGIDNYLFKPTDPNVVRKLLASIALRPHVREDSRSWAPGHRFAIASRIAGPEQLRLEVVFEHDALALARLAPLHWRTAFGRDGRDGSPCTR